MTKDKPPRRDRPASRLEAVPEPKPPAAPPREPSRLMSLLIVDVLSARKVTEPVPPASDAARKTNGA